MNLFEIDNINRLEGKALDLGEKLTNKEAIIGIVGLGYVGMPIAMEYCKKGFNAINLCKLSGLICEMLSITLNIPLLISYGVNVKLSPSFLAWIKSGRETKSICLFSSINFLTNLNLKF